MKTAIIFSDGIKQIVFTPENDDEKQALKLITPNDDIDLAIIQDASVFSKNEAMPFRANVGVCKRGYLRAFTDEESIMLVLSPKEKKEPPKNDIMINECKFTLEQMRRCFMESRLTNPLVGFKYDTFEDYITPITE